MVSVGRADLKLSILLFFKTCRQHYSFMLSWFHVTVSASAVINRLIAARLYRYISLPDKNIRWFYGMCGGDCGNECSRFSREALHIIKDAINSSRKK